MSLHCACVATSDLYWPMLQALCTDVNFRLRVIRRCNFVTCIMQTGATDTRSDSLHQTGMFSCMLARKLSLEDMIATDACYSRDAHFSTARRQLLQEEFKHYKAFSCEYTTVGVAGLRFRFDSAI
ncbi:hypothetical protein ABBQ38_014263 [Trebouxia sp. C0009 RCD-2024]